MGETIYVAVNQVVRESKPNLLWTLGNFRVTKLVLLHIHAPFSLTTSSCPFDQSEIDAIKESQVEELNRSLRKYRIICTDKGVNEEDVDTLCIPGYDVGEEIVNLIHQNKIEKLVMGAAADTHYSRKMSITSRKAKYVSEHAPRGCELWFICKGKLITTIQGSHLGNPSKFSGSAQKPIKGNGTDDTETHKEHTVSVQIRPEKRNKQPKKLNRNESEADSTPDPPHEYICPITWGIMRDPHVAADGYTYEAEAFREHLRKGSKNSPQTNLPLQHYNLTPNRNLATMIKEWLEKHPNYED